MGDKSFKDIKWKDGAGLSTDVRDKILVLYSEKAKAMVIYKKLTLLTSIPLLILAFIIGVVWFGEAVEKLVVALSLLWLVFILNWTMSTAFYRYPIQLNTGKFKYALCETSDVYNIRVKVYNKKVDKLNIKEKINIGDTVMLIKLSDANMYAVGKDTLESKLDTDGGEVNDELVGDTKEY